MYAINVKTMHESPSGIRTVRAFIVSDTAPNILPANGKDVKGLTETDVFAPFSILYVIADVENKVYIADESGAFVPQ